MVELVYHSAQALTLFVEVFNGAQADLEIDDGDNDSIGFTVDVMVHGGDLLGRGLTLDAKPECDSTLLSTAQEGRSTRRACLLRRTQGQVNVSVQPLPEVDNEDEKTVNRA